MGKKPGRLESEMCPGCDGCRKPFGELSLSERRELFADDQEHGRAARTSAERLLAEMLSSVSTRAWFPRTPPNKPFDPGKIDWSKIDLPRETPTQPMLPIPDLETCPDCKGSGKYRGFFVEEDCRTCGGKGRA